MVIGALRCDIRVVVTRYKRVEIIDRTSAATSFFCTPALRRLLVYDRQRHIAGSLERDLLSLARLDRQCIGCRIASGGNRDHDRRIAVEIVTVALPSASSTFLLTVITDPETVVG